MTVEDGRFGAGRTMVLGRRHCHAALGLLSHWRPDSQAVRDTRPGLAPATRAYAWSSPIEGSAKRRFFAVLHMGAIKSPRDR